MPARRDNVSHAALKSPSLVAFVAEPAGARMSVIIEARRPPLASSVVAAAKQLMTGRIPVAGRTQTVPLPVVAPAQMGALEDELKRLGLQASARRLEAAGAFVVEVDPMQLRELAAAPSVQAIRPNRRHRRTS